MSEAPAFHGLRATPEQEAAVRALGDVVVQAGAGAGKTHLLAERYLAHLQAGLGPLEVVAITFTEAAARELKARVRRRVAEAMPQAHEALAELEAAPIGTLHALAARICHEHAEAAEVPADFTVLDDWEGRPWRRAEARKALATWPELTASGLAYGALEALVMAWLDDPLSVESALEADASAWPGLVAQERQAALSLFVDDDTRRAAALRLSGLSGQGPFEERRQAAVGAWGALQDAAEGEADAGAALEALASIDLRGGRRGDWPTDALPALKDDLRVLREAARDARRAGLLTLAWGAADEALLVALPWMRQALAWVEGALALSRQSRRALDYAELERHALKALGHEAVRTEYQGRWRAFLVDEAQDLNPTQLRLLAALTEGQILAVVGDPQQAIYAFRGADPQAFAGLAQQGAERGAQALGLATSFRTHAPLLGALALVWPKLLGEAYVPMQAQREASPGPGPHLMAWTLEADAALSSSGMRKAEARRVAMWVAAALAEGRLVQDRATGESRPMRPGDVAVLARAWEPLDGVAEALAEAGVPVAMPAGGDLLATRPAQDGLALLRALADTEDDLALVAALRSPLFALSDPTLWAFAQSLPSPWAEGTSGASVPGRWGRALAAGLPVAPAPLAEAHECLGRWRHALGHLSPSLVLAEAARERGLEGVWAALPGGARRLADWRGFVALVRRLEAPAGEALAVVRRLEAMLDAELNVPRPALASGDAVSLMTIHGAKGLEWPVVLAIDLARRSPPNYPPLRVKPGLGLALRLEAPNGDRLDPALYQVLAARASAEAEAEGRRLVYVALTRARDVAIASAAGPDGGLWEALGPALAAAGVAPEWMTPSALLA